MHKPFTTFRSAKPIAGRYSENKSLTIYLPSMTNHSICPCTTPHDGSVSAVWRSPLPIQIQFTTLRTSFRTQLSVGTARTSLKPPSVPHITRTPPPVATCNRTTALCSTILNSLKFSAVTYLEVLPGVHAGVRGMDVRNVHTSSALNTSKPTSRRGTALCKTDNLSSSEQSPSFNSSSIASRTSDPSCFTCCWDSLS